MAGRQKRPNSSKHNRHIDQLLVLFPGGDPGYFRSCLGYYDSSPVERIAEKIFSNGGYYPRQCEGNDKTQQMNHCLQVLATEVFPDCSVSYLREKLLKYSHSYMEQVTEELLQEQQWPERLEYGGLVPRSDLIKSEAYKAHALQQLVADYPQVWKSSIRAVMAENNCDYVKSYDQLADMGTGGFWMSLRNFFRHWSVGGGSSSSSSGSSGDAMATSTMDHELEEDIKTIKKRALDAQAAQDHRLAQEINANEEYETLVACECCYGDYTLEQLAYCSTGQHTFCHECIRRFMAEGLFGQGTLRGVGRIPCIAMTGCCDGCLPVEALRHIVPRDMWLAYERSLLDDCHVLDKMVRCQACGYGELDETTQPLNPAVVSYALNVAKWLLMVVVVVIVMLTVLHGYSVWSLNVPLLLLLCATTLILPGLQWDLKADLDIVYDRIACERRGSVFRCRDPECRKVTCLRCHRIVRGLHKCWEKEQDGLRLYVEKAMADAVKRTCPVCNLSFQKSDGCNKIVCRCGYTMCYVCRKDIRKESYAHFCDHFREVAGSCCDQCTKCDLYKTEPEDEAVQMAAARARKEYLKAHPDLALPPQQDQSHIGPITFLEQIDDLRRETVLWLLQRTVDVLV